jgi:citrate lyase subunit beta/citryl-CoA lyase
MTVGDEGAGPIVPRRSVLYMPAANARALEKAKTIPADALILDLEDAVAPDAKPTARDQACAAVAGGGYGRREVTVRCNGLDTPWGADDIAAAAAVGPAAIVVPKVSGALQLGEIADRLERAGAPEHTMIWPMVETPTALFAIREIAGFPRVAALILGTNDLAKELRAALIPGRTPLLPHLATALLGAREAGVAAIDGVYNDVHDLTGFEAECVQGAQLGYDGKTLIHPGQVEIANRVWAPSDEEIDYARRVIDAFEQALAERRGVVTVEAR